MKFSIAAITAIHMKAVSPKTVSLRRGEHTVLGRYVAGVRVLHGRAWITSAGEFYAVREGHEVYFEDRVPHTLSAEGKSGLMIELL